MRSDVVIIGAGSAGLICAIECGKRGRSVRLLEGTGRIGSKIAVSGGGRCNFTNRSSTNVNFVSSNPHFCKSALSRFSPDDMIRMIEKRGIPYHERKWGQLFLDVTSGEIVRMLHEEGKKAGADIIFNCKISEVTKEDSFKIVSSAGTFYSQSVVVATGGLSMPEMGATAFGYQLAEQFGLKVVACRPALVPLKWNREDAAHFGELSGLSMDAVVSYEGRSFHENILLTHTGLSGPAILQISLYWREGSAIRIDLLPQKDIFSECIAHRRSKIEISTLLSSYLPKRFAKKWCERYVPAQPMNRYSEKELKKIAEQLHEWRITPLSREGYDLAEVTAGGVDTNEFSSKTMEAKKVPGLYFIGEVLDVTGHLGGHNLQWAWSSGFAAGQSA